jgi:hypothetical protein
VSDYVESKDDVCQEGIFCEQCNKYSAIHLTALVTSTYLPNIAQERNNHVNYVIALSEFFRVSDTPPP